MREHTPTTTDEIRNAFAGTKVPGTYEGGLRRAFDRWLTARDRENRAIGWDEGFDKGFYVDLPRKFERDASEANTPNPYRGDTRGDTR